MTIEEIQLSPQQWKNFWVYFDNEPQQQEAIEMLRQFINEADPTLLTQTASWIQKYREKPEVGTAFTPDKPFSFHVTEHVTYGELCNQEEARRFYSQQQCNTAVRLCTFLERVRAHFGGRPIVITSGHRPEPINRQVGGAVGSEHTYSLPNKGAVDFYLDGVSLATLQDYCDEHWDYSVGYGAPKGFVHLGMRGDSVRRRWHY